MGRIAERFAMLRERGERALVPFVTAGDPDLETTEQLIPALVEAGADRAGLFLHAFQAVQGEVVALELLRQAVFQRAWAVGDLFHPRELLLRGEGVFLGLLLLGLEPGLLGDGGPEKVDDLLGPGTVDPVGRGEPDEPARRGEQVDRHQQHDDR